MIKRRSHRSDEILLIPFLDILCSLIGVLVLIIVVLCVAQTQKISGRTPEEVQRALEHQGMLKEKLEYSRINEMLKDKFVKLEKLRTQTKQKDEQVAKLRILLNASSADQKKLNEGSQNLMKELDNLLVELTGLNAQDTPLKKQIAALEEEIKKRRPPPNSGASVVVQPGGSGLTKGTKAFFVEADGGKLTFYWNEKMKSVVVASPEVVATDASFNAFLKAVAAKPQSKIIFLLRDNGTHAYNLGAGWAQATYGFKVAQIGRLPIPGRGEINLKSFSEFLGNLTPPPEARIIKTPAIP